MQYVLGLKKEIGLLNENEARERYLELLAMGYSERDIVCATPVPVQVHLNIGQPVAGTETGTQNNLALPNAPDGHSVNTPYSDGAGLNEEGDRLPSETLS